MTKRIIIVDDENIITETLNNLLDIMTDYEIKSFNNPEMVLEDQWVKEGKFDLLITDFLMPEINGYELISKINKIYPNTISILLTGYADKENAIKFINDTNLYYYLEKPWDNNEILKIIENGLDKAKLQDALSEKVIELEKSNYEINRLFRLLKEDNKELTIKADSHAFKYQTILDNVNQGFLMLNDQLRIDPGYSMACINIFERQIDHLTMYDLFPMVDIKDLDFYKDIFGEVFIEGDMDKVDLYLSLLPGEFYLNRKYVKVEYKLIKQVDGHEMSSKKLLVMLTDITDNKSLENDINMEHQIMDFVAECVKSRDFVVDLYTDYNYFIFTGLDELFTSLVSHVDVETGILNLLEDLFRKIHTFKGSFAQFKFINTPRNLHQMESTITGIINAYKTNKTSKMVKEGLSKIDFKGALTQDLNIISEKLGIDFLDLNVFAVEKDVLMNIEHSLNRVENFKDLKEVTHAIRKIRYMSVLDILGVNAGIVEAYSSSLNKPMRPLVIEGVAIELDPDYYGEFFRNLTHVYRNAMIHGIETEEVRVTRDKNQYGTIKTRVVDEGDFIVIEISDDGGGIDYQSIGKSLVGKGLYDAIDDIPEADLINSIFQIGLSTSRSLDLDSGRGVGLNAVWSSIKKLKGHVSIKENSTRGTTFEFKLPHLDRDSFQENILEVISQKTMAYFKEDLLLDLVESKSRESFDFDNYLCASIKLNGINQYYMNLKLEAGLMTAFIDYLKSFNEFSDIVEVNLADELANIIAGNSLEALNVLNGNTDISVPMTCYMDTFHEMDKGMSRSFSSDYGNLLIELYKTF